jgi:hypothetical protein
LNIKSTEHGGLPGQTYVESSLDLGGIPSQPHENNIARGDFKVEDTQHALQRDSEGHGQLYRFQILPDWRGLLAAKHPIRDSRISVNPVPTPPSTSPTPAG